MSYYLQARFSGSVKTYTYKYPEDLKLSVGDHVIVLSPNYSDPVAIEVVEDLRGKYKPNPAINYKEIIGVVHKL